MKGWMKSAIALLVIGSVITGSALAGKPTGTSSVTLVRLADAAARVADGGEPIFAEKVTFSVQASIDRPFVLNECRQNGVLVYSELHGFFEGSAFGTTYSLGPTTMWQGGEADCIASLVDQSKQRTRVLATTSYHVAAT